MEVATCAKKAALCTTPNGSYVIPHQTAFRRHN